MLFSIVTVSAFDYVRLEKTFLSLLNLRVPIEYVVVVPRDDQESIKLFEVFKSQFSFPSKLLFDTGDGVYEAMNIGLTVASGKYVIFWNSGDVLIDATEFENLQQECLESNSKWIIFGATFDWMPTPPINQFTHLEFVKHASNAYLSHQQIAVEREYFLASGGFDSKYRVAADFKCIEFFSHFEPDVHASKKIIEVEFPSLSSKLNRIGRFETFCILFRTCPPNLPALWNITKRELRDLTTRLRN